MIFWAVGRGGSTTAGSRQFPIVILCQLLNELVLPALLQELVGAIVRRSQGLLRILETELGGGFGSARTAFCCSGLETHSEIRAAGESKIQSFPRLGGLHHRYAVAA